MTVGPERFRLKFGMLLIRGSIPLVAVSFLVGCASLPPKSLCFMDFVSKTCWVDRPNGVGFKFEDMADQQIRCHIEPNTPCWYSLDSHDLTRIVDKL